MSLFAVTFPHWFLVTPHPTFPSADPAGFVLVDAPDWDAARALTIGELGHDWAQIIPVNEFDAHHYPRGELARWTTDGAGPVAEPAGGGS